MAAALEAGLPLRLNIVLIKTNAHEQDAMIAMAERWGLIGRRPGDTQEAGEGPLEFVPDLDVYLEHAMCSCNASDDNPY